MPSATAHELNYNDRFSFEPVTPATTLGQYMVAEGLAKAFAAELFGDWSAGQFGHASNGVPNFAEYTLGFRTVRAYLERTGRTAAEATDVPWREIVEGNGVFA